ncbi:TetR/AcrR family transcriptional regulator [Tractidigestivibacter montrealensis]|uniref:TetR/AcrR family transcriptional regulator n=1 Tax=Tractidigestivibacter montrealensis TaxID=2972466 RepID=A0ABT1Z979_9ACTN|nr:TetR/AcrR family transcriptional regulator [Tractidigestivibacter montrealensis]MCR9036738.1 TetR/AcrR family transcriptional regulator [Tractidigestivibacter montrealensis]
MAQGESTAGLAPAVPQERSLTGDARMDRAVECAAGLFLKRRIADVRMTDVADAAGVGVATLYRRFSTKTRLALVVGTLLWRRFNERIVALVESDAFLGMSGADRLERMLRLYAEGYVENAGFVLFIDDLDGLLVTEGAPLDAVAAYGREVDSFYLIFADAYQLGLQDGSVAREVDFPVFYWSVAHALMGVAQKLARGEVIPSDDFSSGAQELECIVDMAVRALR